MKYYKQNKRIQGWSFELKRMSDKRFTEWFLYKLKHKQCISDNAWNRALKLNTYNFKKVLAVIERTL
jgi:hypothetical protein